MSVPATSGVLSTLLDLLFPPRCVFCRKLLQRGERYLCAPCGRCLPFTGDAATQTLSQVSCCVSPLWYRDDVRSSIHRYKFQGRDGYAAAYGKLMADCVTAHLSGRYDLITWAPLSADRRKRRGYDQAMLLAYAAALELDVLAADTLQKVRSAPPQSGLEGAAARRDNVRDAYAVPDPALVAGRRILLVDDVVTTGSTLSECARMLRLAGAADVVCATLARTEGSGSENND